MQRVHSSSSVSAAMRLKKLIAANQALAQVESLSSLLPVLLRFAKDVTNALAASILLYKPETGTLEFSLAINEQPGAAEQIISQKFELKLGQGIAGCVAQTRESIIVEDAQNDQRFYRKADEATGFVTKSILCSPIVYREELLGVVQVLNAKDKDLFENEDLDILESFSHLAAVAMIRSRLLEKKLAQERMQVQLDAAARIQANFLPKIPDLGQESHIFAVSKPAIFVGGDFYDLIPMPDGSIVVCVADVSGKGLPASLVGASLWSKLRSLALPDLSSGELLQQLNSAMYDVLSQQLFATLVIARYWPVDGRVSLALAGHLPPAVVSNTSIQYLSELKGQPVGIDPVVHFGELTITLPVDSSLLLVTDGVTEARNEKREFFGEQGMEDHLRQNPGPPWGESLVAHVESWRGNVDASDDLTVVEIWRKAG